MKPVLLDLFCGAGGATRGYQDAGFYVVGVDNKPMPRYCGDEFVQADALVFLDFLIDNKSPENATIFGGWHFDAIHASPPCQAFTALKTTWNAKPHDDLLTPTRGGLIFSGLPYVIENVPGAPMRRDIVLCGTMFGLGVGKAELRRHRWFETNWPVPLLRTPCAHKQRPITIGVYGQHGRDRRRGVQTFFSVADGKVAMGIDWMSGDELSQAIPPTYTRYIGAQLMQHISQEAAL